jgi:hypothetical protein
VTEALAAEGMKIWHHVVLSVVRDLAPVAQAAWVAVSGSTRRAWSAS